ncbi:MAG TPA: 16S rRNA (cytidine(1402)-2'-O)-methyltransferase [Xanthomonadales bacterium]|nr:16S rRNA (cytidine(1402)-2'-O)-methyltransferase [Xanthomonadales bacterium]
MSNVEPKAQLFVVATPIGNLADISQRAIDTLAKVDLVAAEDTRHSRTLLASHQLDRPMVALHEHNEESMAPRLVERLLAGESIALVSDAGTPLLSDPGYRLVRLAIESGIRVTPLPGPSSIVTALSVAGIPTDRFVFEGFLPAKQAARVSRLNALSSEPRTLVFFESNHRILDCLQDLASTMGPDRQIAACRELTKQFETILRGSVEQVRQMVAADANQQKGEFVLVLAGAPENADEKMNQAISMARALQEYLSSSQAARVAAKLCGTSRRDLYALLGSE